MDFQMAETQAIPRPTSWQTGRTRLINLICQPVGGRSSTVESKLVELVVAGSNPVGHPIFISAHTEERVHRTPVLFLKTVINAIRPPRNRPTNRTARRVLILRLCKSGSRRGNNNFQKIRTLAPASQGLQPGSNRIIVGENLHVPQFHEHRFTRFRLQLLELFLDRKSTPLNSSHLV